MHVKMQSKLSDTQEFAISCGTGEITHPTKPQLAQTEELCAEMRDTFQKKGSSCRPQAVRSWCWTEGTKRIASLAGLAVPVAGSTAPRTPRSKTCVHVPQPAHAAYNKANGDMNLFGIIRDPSADGVVNCLDDGTVRRSRYAHHLVCAKHALVSCAFVVPLTPQAAKLFRKVAGVRCSFAMVAIPPCRLRAPP